MNRFESVLVCELNCAVKTIICCKQSIEPSSASESSGRSSSSRTVVPVALVSYLINATSQPCPLSEWLKILISSNYYYINKLHTHTHTHIRIHRCIYVTHSQVHTHTQSIHRCTYATHSHTLYIHRCTYTTHRHTHTDTHT